ncbi:MAG: hypothetical protein WC385_00795 [Candidatus Paceibacterota bacterium]|jgi:hypothetical protein
MYFDDGEYAFLLGLEHNAVIQPGQWNLADHLSLLGFLGQGFDDQNGTCRRLGHLTHMGRKAMRFERIHRSPFLRTVHSFLMPIL